MSITQVPPMIEAPAALAQVASVVEELAAGGWWRVGGSDLGETLAQAGRLRHEVARLEAHAAAEAISRGLPAGQGMTAVDYLVKVASQYAPAPPRGQAIHTARIAETINNPSPGVQNTLAGFDAGLISTSKASAIIQFHDEVETISDAEALATTMKTVNEGAADQVENPEPTDDENDDGDATEVTDKPPVRRCGWTDRQLSLLLRRARRTIKPPKDLEAEEHGQRIRRALYTLPAAGGMTEYRVFLDPEGAAIIDATLSALSKPQPAEDGTPDPRSAPRRRADALVTIIQRGVSAPEGISQTTKAQVFVTIPLSDLRSETNGAGITMTGQVLSPETVRRMACDASIIPAVLGSKGEILDQGHDERLFTRAQQRALWHRDKGCSFPGCTIPAQWCQAHHVQFWANGGPTDLANGALLCQRHHTHVHSHDLTATVTPTGVTWHT
ncbi:DUF222 domain-containing protein [Pseudactinotalea sp. Z1739]|uniref:HNH endonuclease signature motif containing protein n=1 Tax=Pseudactinotalea sp. Z1739 TaxID=3413028 RepID=UPI003C79F6E8